MAALKLTGIIFLVYLTVIAHVYADKKKKCCQRLEKKIDALTTMVENLDCQRTSHCFLIIFLYVLLDFLTNVSRGL